jgi:ABC-type multidrug transport system fused ATPase/permease subunit
LNLATQHCTTLIIAHRLKTIQSCDVIHVLENGKIVESGTHAELMQLQRHYFSMVEQQSLVAGDKKKKPSK